MNEPKKLRTKIKRLAEDEGKSMTWLAEQLNTTPQKLNSKFIGKSISLNTIEEILKPIGYRLEIKFIKEDETHE